VSESFSAIVVPSDLGSEHDRAVAVAGTLSVLGDLPISLVTVSSPGMPEESDRLDLRRVAETHQLSNWSAVVLHDNDPIKAIAAHVASLERPLVIVASSVRIGLSELVAPDRAGQLLSELSCPALILGPNVPEDWEPVRPHVISCVGRTAAADLELAPIARWVNTFGSDGVHVVTVVGPDERSSSSADVDADARERVSRLVAELQTRFAIAAQSTLVHDDEPVNGVLGSLAGLVDAVLVVTSQRWPDGSRVHRRSVARRLAHDSTVPVLVIAHLAH
jgi:nucleotide-binding universal stress UspA family protein